MATDQRDRCTATRVRHSRLRLGAAVSVVVTASLLAAVRPATGQATRASSLATTCSAQLCPAWSTSIGKVWVSSPTFATIDGVRAVVSASLAGRVYVVDARTGRALPGWQGGRPVSIRGTPTAVDSSPAVAYLDGPGRPPSIIVGAGSLWDKNQNGGLIAFNANGSVRFVVHTHNEFNEWASAGGGNYDNSVFATPAVGDLRGNGQQDIVFSSYDHRIYALNPEGRLLPGFPIDRADTIWSSAVLADTSHTGRDDIIVGGDSSGLKDQQGKPCYGGWITDYRFEPSGPRLVWEHCVGQTIWSSPAVGVINSSGREAVVVGTSYDQNHSYLRSPATHEVFAWYADNGQGVPGWPVNAGGSCNDPGKYPAGGTFGSPAIVRITPSGGPVVISSSHAHCEKGPGVVTEWTGSGHRVWSEVVNRGNEELASPAVVDMNGDGVNDVVIGTVDGMVVLNGETGAFMDGTGASPLERGCNVSGAPAVSPVAGVGASGWEMVFACGIPANNGGYGYLVAFPLPHAPPHPPGWSEWRANPQRSGVPDPVGAHERACRPPRSSVGYRLASAGGQEIAGFGTLPYCGGAGGDVLPVPVVAETGTPDGGGYWLLLADGAVYAFGDARWYGDARTGTYHLAKGLAPPGAPMTGIASTRDGRGYWLTDGMGDVYAFGDAAYHGSRSGHSIDGTVVGISSDPHGAGYWLVTSRGMVYAFDAPDRGSAATRSIKGPVVGMAAAPTGSGYWLVTRAGAVFGYGVASHGSLTTVKHAPIVGIVAAAGGRGYYLAASDGGIFTKGAAHFYGSGVGKLDGESIVSLSGG